MLEHLVLGLTVLLWIVTVVKAVDLRGARATSRTWLWFTLLLLAVAGSFFAASPTLRLERLTGVGQISDVLGRTALLGAAFSSQSLILSVTTPGGAEPMMRSSRAVPLGLATVAMWCTFAAGSAAGGVTFGSRAETSFWSEAFTVAFAAYFTYALLDVLLRAARYSSSASGQPLATGLQMIAMGAGLGVVYAVVKIVAIGMDVGGRPMPFLVEAVVGQTSAMAGGVLVALGSCWPSLRRRQAELRAWAEAYRVHRELYPLWSALMAVAPALALEPVGSQLLDRLRVRDMDMRVYRRIIEIRDGELELRPHLDAAVADQAMGEALASGCAVEDATAIAEARMLETGIASASRASTVTTPWTSRGPDSGSTAGEISWMCSVARHFRPPPGASEHALLHPHRAERLA